jgi:hypothetical protein
MVKRRRRRYSERIVKKRREGWGCCGRREGPGRVAAGSGDQRGDAVLLAKAVRGDEGGRGAATEGPGVGARLKTPLGEAQGNNRQRDKACLHVVELGSR